MIQIKKTANAIIAVSLFLLLVVTTSCSNKSSTTDYKSEIDSLRNQISILVSSNSEIASDLTKFDTLDFTVFSNQEWNRLGESHSKDIKVYFPDGHMEQGLETHIETLKKMFVHAPDTRVKEHPIKFGSGKYTAVIGTREGTFSKPFPLGNGKFIQPTGKKLKIPMATIGVWENGLMTTEYLFWDNAAYMKQFGIGN